MTNAWQLIKNLHIHLHRLTVLNIFDVIKQWQVKTGYYG